MEALFRPLPLPSPVCWHFRQRGSCSRGDACRFAHVVGSAGSCGESAGASESGYSGYYWLYRMPVDPNEYRILVRTLEAHGLRRATTPEEEALAVLLWCGSSTIPAALRLDGSALPPDLVVNRLGCGASITQKDRLVISLRLHSRQALAPTTFILPAEHEELAHCQALFHGTPFIVKPYNTGCGRGVFVTQDAVQQVKPGANCVVSQYIERPLLVEGKKLDLRLFVLVLPQKAGRASTGDAGQGCGGQEREVFISRHGLVRFAARKFSCQDLRTSRDGGSKDRKDAAKDSVPGRGNTERRSSTSAGVSGEFDPQVHLVLILLHRTRRF